MDLLPTAMSTIKSPPTGRQLETTPKLLSICIDRFHNWGQNVNVLKACYYGNKCFLNNVRDQSRDQSDHPTEFEIFLGYRWVYKHPKKFPANNNRSIYFVSKYHKCKLKFKHISPEDLRESMNSFMPSM